MTTSSGDRIVHLQHGLARVVAIKTSPLVAAVIRVDASGAEHWVPLSAWTEHAIAIPTREDAEAWRASVLADGARPYGGDALARERARTLEHRGFDRQLAALRDAYRCGDRGGYAQCALEALEERLLPVLAVALETSVDALRAELRAAMPAQALVPVPVPVAALDGLEPLGRAELTEESCIGTELRGHTRPGTWLGYVWTCDRHDAGHLVALHEAVADQWPTLRRTLEPQGRAHGSQALVFQPSMADDPYETEMLYDRSGELGGKGFGVGAGGSGPYGVWGVGMNDELVCIVVGWSLDAFGERLLQGFAPVAAALATCEEWRRGRAGEPVSADREIDDALVAALEVLVEHREEASVTDELARIRGVLESAGAADRCYADVLAMLDR